MSEDEQIVRDRAFDLLSALTLLLWSIERGIGVPKSLGEAQRLRDEIRREREAAFDSTQSGQV